MNQCKIHPVCSLAHRTGERVRLSKIYRQFLGNRQGQKVWIVDGAKVCLDLYPEFIMGGNDQRYRFNPLDDIWIDNRLGIEELHYTLEHELIERHLMQETQCTYVKAHDEGGLLVEAKMRNGNERRVARRQRTLDPLVAGVYRMYFGQRGGVKIWVVDGPLVRKTFFPDFCFATHDLRRDFVPEKEIWLDSAMAIEEAHFNIIQLTNERALMAAGKEYAEAYEVGQRAMFEERVRQAELVSKHEAVLPMVTYGVRNRGFKRA